MSLYEYSHRHFFSCRALLREGLVAAYTVLGYQLRSVQVWSNGMPRSLSSLASVTPKHRTEMYDFSGEQYSVATDVQIQTQATRRTVDIDHLYSNDATTKSKDETAYRRGVGALVNTSKKVDVELQERCEKLLSKSVLKVLIVYRWTRTNKLIIKMGV